jgi:UDP-N-acetyl-D-mannosaminuronic acid dehydrogenase
LEATKPAPLKVDEPLRVNPHVCVLGLGYIGLPLAAMLATRGIRVSGVDVQPHVVETLNKGEIHIEEIGLEEILYTAVAKGRFRAYLKPVDADVYVIAVPTPVGGEHEPDLSYVFAAADSIADCLRPGSLIIIESTCPVQTTELVRDRLAAKRTDLTFPDGSSEPSEDQVHMAYCPERVIPGRVMEELVGNDRVIGGLDPVSADKGAAFYRHFVKGDLIRTDARTAEMCKLAENAFRDLNIAYANELASIAERFGVNPFRLIEYANRHPRVSILQPGPGVGGHCIAVDPWFLVHSAPDLSRIIRTAREVNDARPLKVIQQIYTAAEGIKNPVIACLGLAFKQDVDDLRESPSLDIVKHLAQEGVGKILAVEPYIGQLPKALEGHGVELLSAEEAIPRADVVVLLVAHRQFLELDRELLLGKRIIDTRGVWN